MRVAEIHAKEGGVNYVHLLEGETVNNILDEIKEGLDLNKAERIEINISENQ